MHNVMKEVPIVERESQTRYFPQVQSPVYCSIKFLNILFHRSLASDLAAGN